MLVLQAISVTSGGGVQEDIKEEDEDEEEEDEKKDDVFEPEKKLLPGETKEESSNSPGISINWVVFHIISPIFFQMNKVKHGIVI